MKYKTLLKGKNIFFALFTAVALSLPSFQAIAQENPGGETVDFKLIKINGSQFNFLALKSKDVLQKYSKIYYVPMSAKNLVLKKSGDGDIDRSWKRMKPEDWYGFTSVFDDMFPKYFPADKPFSLTDKVGADVLGVQFRLSEYTPRVSRKGELGQATIGSQESRNYGDLMIIIMLIDSVTGDTIGVASDGIVLGAGDLLAKNSSTASQMIGWQRAYEIWLKKLRTQLEASRSN
jgi:hypothetical protein